MQKQKPTGSLGQSTDTEGMDLFFNERVSAATADTSKPSTMEVSISEAAKLLGISERTVWRRVIKKELKSRTKNKKRLVVLPIIEAPVTLTEDCQVHVSQQSYNANAVLDLQLLLKELQGANYRIGYLESENKTYQKQVLMLPDLEAEAKRALIQEQELQNLKAELNSLKRSWWYKLGRFLSGRRTTAN
ncbi:MAG: helix-turn-helix domain-containing protein [Candidatus Obscuribacterales bacterium]|jgi:predicted DNA-binding transcriptional regulator AlpA|nr:helix-turn-helix domain-containing protein [Candidatus Obscuribacterales bacterium]